MPDSAEPKRRNALRTRRRGAELVVAGRCRACGRERGETGTRTMCRACADRVIVCARERSERLKARGLCVGCGREPAGAGHIRCRACRDRTQAKTREREGLSPFVPREERRYKLSEDEREYLRRKQQESRARRRAEKAGDAGEQVSAEQP